ncbi:hypothetical protein [Microbacterium candidum]|uniref:Uncharacterized protein n=1 Tax=Microbacterium candidum TaxID=3041922 RepID=A0ABT7MW23_9MICO|nr:hypothetical protein [Microbacterium sp. ASV49]MDL9978654.1 hypothetical protein [Microbacterium sp. ASV49]
MPARKRYTRQEKIDLLSAYADAIANNPDFVEVWVEAVELDPERLATWRQQLNADELVGDETELPEEFAQDGSIAALANLYRAHITQVKPGAHTVQQGSAAGLVVYDTYGAWRLDFLARARSALRTVISAAETEPEEFLKPHGIEPATAIAAVRAAWGVDRFPRVERPEDPKAREAADRRIARWTDQVAANSKALDALKDWYRRQEPSLIPLPRHPSPAPPTWQEADPKDWPRDGEGRWLKDMAEWLLGELMQLARLGDERQRIIVMRRTAEAISDYIRDDRHLAGAKIYYQHHVVRLWQWYSMEDLRTPEERAGTRKAGATDKPIIAAVAAMCLHTVLRDWDPKAAGATIRRALDMFEPFSPSRPEENHRMRAVAHRKQQAELPKLKIVSKPNFPAFIRNVSPAVAKLFFESDLLRMAPGPVKARDYISARRAIREADRTRGNGRAVIQLADYAANLAVASPAVRKKLWDGQLRDLKAALLKSTQGEAMEAALRRNDALALQKRSYDGAITEGLQGLNTLKRQRQGGAKVLRDQLIMEEQLCMNLAGSAVQWLEQMLGGDPEWQEGIEQRQWTQLTNAALHHSTRAVEIIEQLHADGELATQRYSDGFLADENFLFRAWDILYRCTCAAATAAAAFKLDNQLRSRDYKSELNEVHLAVTTIDKPISVSELPRLMHSMLWHSFLSGGVLPALKYDTLNGALVDKDALTRVLTPEEIADPECQTVMTYTRIALLTDWLIQRGWTAGAMGLVQPRSRVWDVLDERSGKLYSVWREDFGTLLTSTRDDAAATPPRVRYSFHETINYPGTGGR